MAGLIVLGAVVGMGYGTAVVARKVTRARQHRRERRSAHSRSDSGAADEAAWPAVLLPLSDAELRKSGFSNPIWGLDVDDEAARARAQEQRREQIADWASLVSRCAAIESADGADSEVVMVQDLDGQRWLAEGESL